ncbi:hypothetical protein ACJ4V0_07755 [Phreatobacter sp. HK31-P]
MDELPADNVAPFPWRERSDLQASSHDPVLRAFDRTIGQINALSVMILEAGLAGDDRNQAMAYLSTAATRMLQANLLYVEKCILPESAGAVIVAARSTSPEVEEFKPPDA